MVKLTELEPTWWGRDGRHGLGITFLCPHCRKQKISVAFINPLDGGSTYPDDKPFWTREGESFETLTIKPSINASKIGHWHGFIRGGDII